ncbi:MAG: hypothetical protein KGS72_07430 [Cyanobacteria bacterium REEB67]|nr:hypothetical protein [Cyanobacteria bacterium REEB67]
MGIVAAGVIGLPALAQFNLSVPQEEYRDPKVFGNFVYMMLPSTTSRTLADGTHERYGIGRARLGADGKTLGSYSTEAHMFNSAYKDLPDDLQEKWAYDLWQYCKARGCSFDVYRKLVGSPLSDQAMNRTAVKYDDQKDFANMWWRRHYPEYKQMGFVFQDQFLNDTIVDATNVWTYFVFLDNPGALSVTWKDELVYRAIAKK